MCEERQVCRAREKLTSCHAAHFRHATRMAMPVGGRWGPCCRERGFPALLLHVWFKEAHPSAPLHSAVPFDRLGTVKYNQQTAKRASSYSVLHACTACCAMCGQLDLAALHAQVDALN